MSELKAISGHEIREDIDYNTRGVDPEDKEWRNYGKELCDTLYYLKAEADAVIAELKEKLKEQTSIAEEGWKEFRTYHTSYAEAVEELYEKNKELRHQKYKRCVDNAWWCRKSSNAYAWSASNLRGWKIAVYYDKKAELYRKWHKRWLELAEKFKEAK